MVSVGPQHVTRKMRYYRVLLGIDSYINITCSYDLQRFEQKTNSHNNNNNKNKRKKKHNNIKTTRVLNDFSMRLMREAFDVIPATFQRRKNTLFLRQSKRKCIYIHIYNIGRSS